MSSLFSSLGINWMLLLAQVVNFAILVFVLTKFLYKPIIKMLDDRKKRIADDLEKSTILETKLIEADSNKEEILAEARRTGEKLIKQSEKNALALKDTLAKEAAAESEKIRRDAKRQIESDRQKTMDELKKELGGLVALSVEKALGDVTDKSTQDKLVEGALKKTR